MATYKITSPDGQSYNVNAPDGASEADVMDYAQRNFKMLAKEEKSGFGVVGNVLAGALRGAGSIGATLLTPYDLIAGNTKSIGNPERRAGMDAGLSTLGADTESFSYGAGKLAGEIAGTAGAGGLIAKPLAAAAPRLASAIASGGFATGAPTAATKLGQAANMGIRMAGGAINGGVSAGMVGDSVDTGAMIGAALPPGAKLAGMAGRAIGRGVTAAVTPEKMAMAKNIAEMTGKSIQEVLTGLQQQGPSMLGIRPTVPQILQDDAISQLQRSAIIGGDKSIMAREAAQNAERLSGLGRVAPVYGTVNEAADSAGNLIGKYGQAARSAETARVSRLFDSVDPFNDTALELPIDAMNAARAKYLGPGTFGMGGAPQTAIDTATRIGTEVLPEVKGITQKAAGKTQSLEQAVRSAGGIRGGAGELRDLGIKQSGTTGLVNNKSGKAADLLAEEMHSRGFIPDNDPATLFDYLRNGQGRNVFSNDAPEGGFSRQFERSMGDPPGAMSIPKPVPFTTVQNFRGSLNEAWKDASMGGRNQEAAALKGMIAEIDNKVSQVAGGGGNVGEAFPADIVETWKEALLAHGQKKARFDTGPQARMFRKGSDGQTAIQGAEIPREFFNSRASQVEDAQAFQKLTNKNPELATALKSYAVTDAAQQTTRDGALSLTKFKRWMDTRRGAITNTMTEQDQALLREVLQGVKAADVAATGGMSKGSNSAQNIAAADRLMGNGLLDSPIVNMLANRTPVIGGLTGPMLSGLRKSAQASKAEKVGGLLADPEMFTSELRKLLSRQQPGRIDSLLSNPDLARFGYRAAPVLMGD